MVVLGWVYEKSITDKFDVAYPFDKDMCTCVVIIWEGCGTISADWSLTYIDLFKFIRSLEKQSFLKKVPEVVVGE